MKDNIAKENISEAILNSWGKFCSICGSKRDEKNIQIVYTFVDGAVIHLDCSGCQRQFVLNVMGMGFQMMPIFTDLSNPEIEKFTNTKSVSIDDLIEVYTVLFENQSADSLIDQFHTSSHQQQTKLS